MERHGIVVRIADVGDAALLCDAAPGVFDHAVQPELAREFLADPRHHLAVAIDDAQVVGMASGVHYVHPDKPAQMFINEVAVAPTHRRQGLGRRLLEALIGRAREVRCVECWVAADSDNAAARALYAAAGGQEQKPACSIFEFRLSES